MPKFPSEVGSEI